MAATFEPLPRLEVIKAVERRYPRRTPLVLAKFWGEGFELLHGEALSRFDRFPEDVVMAMIDPIRFEEMDFPWTINQSGPHDARYVLEDWESWMSSSRASRGLDVYRCRERNPAGDSA